MDALGSAEEVRARFLSTRLAQSIRYVEAMAERTPITSAPGGGKHAAQVRALALELFPETRPAPKSTAKKAGVKEPKANSTHAKRVTRVR